MSDDLTYSEYRDVIDTSAERVAEQVANNPDAEVHELIHQQVDGSHYIMYYHHNPEIIKHSDIEPVEWKIFYGEDASFKDIRQARAYACYQADLYEALNERDDVDL